MAQVNVGVERLLALGAVGTSGSTGLVVERQLAGSERPTAAFRRRIG